MRQRSVESYTGDQKAKKKKKKKSQEGDSQQVFVAESSAWVAVVHLQTLLLLESQEAPVTHLSVLLAQSWSTFSTANMTVRQTPEYPSLGVLSRFFGS